jgi:photosystem II stability/assembly factor-like uncharacterized protein
MDIEEEKDPEVSEQAVSGEPVLSLAAAQDGAQVGKTVFAGSASGLSRSADGGATWQPALESLALAEPVPVVSVAVSPSFMEDRTVIAGVPGGALRSTDGGASWQVLPFTPPPPYITALAFSPRFLEDGVILGGTAEDGILRSANGGDSWSPWNFGLLDLEVLCLAASPDFDRDETIFAGTSSGLFRSSNGGRAWKELALPCGHSAVLSLAVGRVEGGSLTIYAGTEDQGLCFSADGGRTWSLIEGLEGAVNGLVISGSGAPLLAVLIDSRVLVTADQGKSWQRIVLPGEKRAVTAMCAPAGLDLDEPFLLGLESGGVVRLERVGDYLQG